MGSVFQALYEDMFYCISLLSSETMSENGVMTVPIITVPYLWKWGNLLYEFSVITRS